MANMAVLELESSVELRFNITEHELKLKTWVCLSALLLIKYLIIYCL